jgi:hypothetical protein
VTVLFLHIPKAAGTSYGAALADALGGERLVPLIPEEITSEDFQQNVDPDSLRKYSLVAGHVDFGLCRRAPFLRPATVLREPVDRLVSWYHYVLRSEDVGNAPWRRFIESRRLSVEGFLLHPRIRQLMGQAQTVQIAGYQWSGLAYPPVDDLVGEAEANLATFAHVGLYERLGDSLRLAQAELGLASTPTLPDRNVSPERDELDPEVRAAVATRLGMDVAFYEWAVAHFEQRLAAHGLAGEITTLPPPARPPRVAPIAPAAGSPPSSAATASVPGLGDSVEVAWFADVGDSLGGPLAAPLPLFAPADAVEAHSGASFGVDGDAPLDLGANWLRVTAGVYQVQATVPCRRFGDADPDGDWMLLFQFAWYGSPPHSLCRWPTRRARCRRVVPAARAGGLAAAPPAGCADLRRWRHPSARRRRAPLLPARVLPAGRGVSRRRRSTPLRQGRLRPEPTQRWCFTPVSNTSLTRRGASASKGNAAARLGRRMCDRPLRTASTMASATRSLGMSTIRRSL